MMILNFGSCNVDYVYSLEQIVRVGETEVCERMNVFAGGKGLNQSIALARPSGRSFARSATKTSIILGENSR